MKDERKYFELTDRYLSGEMKDEERLSFEKMMEEDVALKKEVELHREINRAVMAVDAESFRDELKSVRNSMKRNRRSLPKALYPFVNHKWLAAASVALLLGLFVLLFLHTKRNYSNGQLYAMYFEPYRSGTLERSATASDSLFSVAMYYYNKHNYEKSIAMLKEYSANNNNENPAVMLYLGISYLETGKADSAEEMFDKILKSDNSLFKEQAGWYLSLTYLKQNKKKKAAELLKNLVEEKSWFSPKAQELLDYLGSQ